MPGGLTERCFWFCLDCKRCSWPSAGSLPSTKASARMRQRISAWGLISPNPDSEYHLENLEMFILKCSKKETNQPTNQQCLPPNTLWSKGSVSEAWKTGRGISRNNFPTDTRVLDSRGLQNSRPYKTIQDRGAVSTQCLQITPSGLVPSYKFFMGLPEMMRNLSLLLSVYQKSKIPPEFSQWNNDSLGCRGSANIPVCSSPLYREGAETEITCCRTPRLRHPSCSPHLWRHTQVCTPPSPSANAFLFHF